MNVAGNSFNEASFRVKMKIDRENEQLLCHVSYYQSFNQFDKNSRKFDRVMTQFCFDKVFFEVKS